MPSAPRAGDPRPRSRLLRWLRAVLVAGAGGALILYLVFPTDTLVRRVVERVTPPGGPFLVFRHATLRPWGLRLDDLALRRPDGSAVATAEWVQLRPSFRGLLRDGTGRPWQVAFGFCGGTIDATVDPDQKAVQLDVGWQDLDLAKCGPLVARELSITGRVSGTMSGRASSGIQPSGTGTLALRDVVWTNLHPIGDDPEHLRADTAAVRWTLAESRLTFEGLRLDGPDVDVTGSGTMRLTGTFTNNLVDLHLVAEPGPEVPVVIQRVLDGLPRATEVSPVARSLVVRGTMAHPEVVRPGSPNP